MEPNLVWTRFARSLLTPRSRTRLQSPLFARPRPCLRGRLRPSPVPLSSFQGALEPLGCPQRDGSFRPLRLARQGKPWKPLAGFLTVFGVSDEPGVVPPRCSTQGVASRVLSYEFLGTLSSCGLQPVFRKPGGQRGAKSAPPRACGQGVVKDRTSVASGGVRGGDFGGVCRQQGVSVALGSRGLGLPTCRRTSGASFFWAECGLLGTSRVRSSARVAEHSRSACSPA